MAEEIRKSLLLQKMCDKCVQRDKELPECVNRRFSCDRYQCSRQPWKPRATVFKPFSYN